MSDVAGALPSRTATPSAPASMLTELRNRGCTDASIVCCDSLKRLPESIRLTWPRRKLRT